MSIAAMKQMVEALEECRRDPRLKYEHAFYDKAITAGRQAIEQAEKPVGQLQEEAYGRGQVMWFNKPADQSMLYTTPQQELLLEPEGRCKKCLTYNGHHDGCSQATPQPQQEPQEKYTYGTPLLNAFTKPQEFGDTSAAYMVGVQDGKKQRESLPVCEYCEKERPVIHAPQREWVGLTNNDLQPITEEYRILFGSWVHDFARAIEAKLKEKNT
jgi:hypothetical protein